MEDRCILGRDHFCTTETERIRREPPVVDKLLTNIMLADEYVIASNLSQHLATRNQRHESVVMVDVKPSDCRFWRARLRKLGI
jgi:hypothetical protein